MTWHGVAVRVDHDGPNHLEISFTGGSGGYTSDHATLVRLTGGTLLDHRCCSGWLHSRNSGRQDMAAIKLVRAPDITRGIVSRHFSRPYGMRDMALDT
jgi:hypothetical protein